MIKTTLLSAMLATTMLVGALPSVVHAQGTDTISSASQLQIDAIVSLLSSDEESGRSMLDSAVTDGSVTPEMLQQIIATLNANGMEDLASALANKYAELLLGVEPAAGPADISGQ